MNALGAGSRKVEASNLLREAGKISLKILPLFALAVLLVCILFVSFIADNPKVKPDQEFFAKEYQELSTMSDNLFGLRLSIRTYKQRMMSSDINNSDAPKPFLTQKQILDWYKVREGYARLLANYYRMALEYNLRHEAVGYRFMYNKNLPDRFAKPLPQRYVSLE